MNKKQIKVLYLITNADPYGSNVALLNMLDVIQPIGVIPVVVMYKYGDICEKLKERGIKYFQIKYEYSIYPKCKKIGDIILYIPRILQIICCNFFAIYKLKKISREYHIDIIHTNISPLHIGHSLSKKLNIPHVWHIREYQDLYMGWHPLFTWKSYIQKLRADNSYPIAITKGLFKHYDMKNNSRVIYDGVMKASQTQFLAEKEKYFLVVGRLEKAKGVMDILHAFIEFAISKKCYNLFLVGNGTEEYTSILKNVVNNARMNDRIKFLGFRNDMPDLMARATALIVGSTYEGFGFTTVEAMFNGCLVIGKNSAGTKEILENHSLGILYNNQTELVHAFNTVSKEGISNYFTMINNAKKTAVQNYSCEKNGEKIFELYTKIYNNKQKTDN